MAREIVDPDSNQITKHLDRIAKEAHPAAFAIVPNHGHLEQAQTLLLRDVEHLRIEAEALDALKLEHRKCRLPEKRFETALSIFEPEPGYCLHQQIEHAASKVSKYRLAHTDQFPVQRARAEAHVGPALDYWIDELWRFGDGR